jgi:hypothetical protein
MGDYQSFLFTKKVYGRVDMCVKNFVENLNGSNILKI